MFIDLGPTMGFLDRLNPFKKTIENVTETIDKLVLDKDAAAQLKAQINMAQIEADRIQMQFHAELMEMREKSYQLELSTKTTPRVDAIHKMARTILAALSMLVSAAAVIWLSKLGIEITMEIVAVLGAGNVAAGIYNFKKGKGYPYAGPQS